MPELYLIVIWTFSISGLRLKYALISASVTFFLITFAGYYYLFEDTTFFLHLLWLFSAFSFGLLNAFLIEKSDIETFIKTQELINNAETDYLTGLFNRCKTQSILSHEIMRVKRYKSSLSIIIIDIDYFKSVNDTFGHHIGDIVLKEFAMVIKNHIRKVDTLGRWGGEEFLLILPETGIREAENVAEHIRVEIEKFIFSVVKQKTGSFGVSEYLKGDNEQSIVIRADKALYKSKENGRNQINSL